MICANLRRVRAAEFLGRDQLCQSQLLVPDEWKEIRKEGHDCFQVRQRRRFIVDKRESIARGRDSWESRVNMTLSLAI